MSRNRLFWVAVVILAILGAGQYGRFQYRRGFEAGRVSGFAAASILAHSERTEPSYYGPGGGSYDEMIFDSYKDCPDTVQKGDEQDVR